MAPRCPRYLHLPIQLLWFDMEDLAILVCCYMLWMIMGSWLVLPLIVLGPMSFMRLKASRPRGYLRHLLVQYGFNSLPGYPPPMVSRFYE